MTQTYSAVVRPRVMASDGETRLLDDIVEEQLRKGRSQHIVIQGARGSGKSFAIQYIAERFATEVNSGMIRLMDVASVRDKAKEATDSNAQNVPLLTLIAARAHDCPNATVYQLAAWDQDDVIEYVLHRFPEQSALLLNRTKDGAFLEGLPELWVLVLEELAANRLLPCVESAVWAILHEVFCTGTALTDAGQMAWDDFQSGKLSEHDSVETDSPKSSQDRLTKLYPVQCLLAAEYFCSKLRTRGGTSILNVPIPEDLLPIIARRLRNNASVISDLAALLVPHSDATLHSSAVTLLLAIDPSWRPSNAMTRMNLNRAILDGAHWSEVDLSHSAMNGTCGNDARFQNCDLSNVHAGHSSFRRSSFRHANLTAIHFHHGFAPDSDFSYANGVRGIFSRADLRDSTFDDAELNEAIFDGSLLACVSFRGAKLFKASFRDADLHNVNFSDCDLRFADLSHLDLTTVQFRGAVLGKARMMGCDLSNTDLSACVVSLADLREADLCGSVARGNMQHVDLRGAKLGDVDWENADLRNADLRFAVFHLGASRGGLLFSPLASEGTRTGFYTDELMEQHFKSPEEIRKANLKGVNLLGADIGGVDFYLVDLRGAIMSRNQYEYAAASGAILHDSRVT